MKYHTAERENVIRAWEERFPAAIFFNGRQRLPLKKNILLDIEKQCGDMDPELLRQTYEFYTEHWAYEYQLLAGADRLDLRGHKAGTVTEAEEREARRRIAEGKKREAAELAARARNGTEPPPARATTNGPEHLMSKTTPLPAAAPALHPSLAEMHAAVAIVSGLLTDAQYAALRTTLATAALREIVNNAERLIGSLQSKEA